MSNNYNSILQTNNTDLQAILNTINELPEAGGNTSNEDALLMGTTTTFTNDRVTQIGDYKFYYCTTLTSVSFPNVISVGESTFGNCWYLTTANLPKATTIKSYAFYRCTRLTSINLPNVTNIMTGAFSSCTGLTTVNFPVLNSLGQSAFNGCSALAVADLGTVKSIGSYAFQYCSSLKTIYLRGSTVCTLNNSLNFVGNSANISIFVPASLVSSYKTATNWRYFSSKIFSIT